MERRCPVCLSAEVGLFPLLKAEENYFGGYRLYECGGCGVVFTHPLPSEAETLGFYGGDYYSFTSLSLESLPWWRHVARALVLSLFFLRRTGSGKTVLVEKLLFGLMRNVPQMVPLFFPGRHILDLGCGAGDQMALWQEVGLDARGVDISPVAALRGSRRGLKIFSGEIWDAGFEGGSFDIVYANHVLEHTRDPHATLKEIERILRPHGVLIIGVPNTASHLLRLFGSRWFPLQVPLHLLHFSPASLHALLAQNGFAVRQVYTVTPAAGLLESLGKVFPGFESVYARCRRKAPGIAAYALLTLLLLPANLGLRGDSLYVIAVKDNDVPGRTLQGGGPAP